MRFAATIRNTAGDIRQEVLDAPTRADAVHLLRHNNQVVLSLQDLSAGEAAGTTGKGHILRDLFSWPVTTLDVEFGLQQLSSMLKSGLPLLMALRTAAEQARKYRAARLWTKLAGGVESGLSLSEAMKSTPKIDSYTLALIQVGEKSGELGQAMLQAAEHLTNARNMRNMIINALIYPILVLLLTFGVAGFMVVKVIPQVQQFLTTGNQTLPYITQTLLDISDALRAYFPYAAIILAAALAAIFLVRLYPRGRQISDAILLNIPLTGYILRISGTAVAARGLSILLESGVHLLDALGVVSRLVRNRQLTVRLQQAQTSVMNGETLSSALKAAPEFLPMLFRMAAVGETTGTLAPTLAEVARFHENLLVTVIRRFGVLMEPILILIVGTIVGFVYIAFFLALFSLATIS